MAIHFNGNYLKGFMADHELGALAGAVKTAHETLHSGTGLGNDFLGWVELPTNYDKNLPASSRPPRRSKTRRTSSSSSASAALIWAPAPPSSS